MIGSIRYQHKFYLFIKPTVALIVGYKQPIMEYYIQNTDAGFIGNAIVFWALNSQGYTAKLENAQKFTFDEAKKICNGNSQKNKAWPVDYIDNNEGTARLTDSQFLEKENIVDFSKTSGIELIMEERERQISSENWTLDHDKAYKNNELFNAAASYSALPERRNIDGDGVPSAWPWAANWWKPTPDNRIRELEKAGALFTAHQEATGFDCSAEIESCAKRIDRLLLEL